MATIINSLKIAYSMAIFRHGTKTFPDIFANYVEPVKEYAAAEYDMATLDRALASGWITQEEYDATVALKEPQV
ncbi:hypothetical protein [Brevibacillus reuszeri]|uniref:hypothetical protein n=1 Tax=Brevibacillus reuszeri TaxID=54915 RepID=UPI000CCC4BF8|nr:hypothetical protein [Brevibacillus reuszeri]